MGKYFAYFAYFAYFSSSFFVAGGRKPLNFDLFYPHTKLIIFFGI